MFEKEFALRLSSLRIQKAVSARDMSLSLGFNPGYINSIETGKALPSMSTFFYICDFFNITPEEFFSKDVSSPSKVNEIESLVKDLNSNEIDAVINIIKVIKEHKA